MLPASKLGKRCRKSTVEIFAVPTGAAAACTTTDCMQFYGRHCCRGRSSPRPEECAAESSVSVRGLWRAFEEVLLVCFTD